MLFFEVKNLRGFDKRIEQFDRFDYIKLNSTLYEFQIAWTLRNFGCDVAFIDEGDKTSPDLLVSLNGKTCEIECKNKATGNDISMYSKSIYQSIQTARKQFSKGYPGIIMIEIDSRYYEAFLQDSEVQLAMDEQITKTFKNSETISAILLSTKKFQDELNCLKYSHSVLMCENPEAKFKAPEWFFDVFRI